MEWTEYILLFRSGIVDTTDKISPKRTHMLVFRFEVVCDLLDADCPCLWEFVCESSSSLRQWS
jgi:hypothetical protein